MSERAHRPMEQDLEAHSAWVHGFARALARDEHAAEDLVQDTWAAALAQPPPREALRPWLARVLRNSFLHRRRGDRHRRAREVVVARAEAEPNGLDTVARLESERLLFEALEALEEPLRATLVARYLGGESAADVARRTGVPAATVRWRIQRGLERMRELLAERGRDRGRSLSALLVPLMPAAPFSSGPVPSGPAPTAVTVSATPGAPWLGLSLSSWFVMQATTKIALATVVSAAGLGLYFAGRPLLGEPSMHAAARGPAALAPGEATLESVPANDPTERGATEAERRAALAGAADIATAEPTQVAAVGPALVLARLVDERGVALVGALAAHYAGAEIGSTSDARGLCRLAMPEEGAATLQDAPLPTIVIVRAPGRVTRFEHVTLALGETENLGELVLVPAARASGIVLLPDGAPAVGAEVIASAVSPRPLDSHVRCGPDEQVHAPRARCDAFGRFELDGLPASELQLWAGHPGMRWAHTPLLDCEPGVAHDDLVLQLAPLAREDHISGRVVDPTGAPVAHAAVRYFAQRGSASHMGNVVVDAEGRFDHRLTLLAPHTLTANDPERRFAAAVAPEVAPGELDLVLRLAELRSLIVEAVAPDGTAVRHFGGELVAADGGQVLRTYEEAQRPEGQLVVELSAPHVSVRVRASGYDLATCGPFDLASAPATVRVELAPLPGIRGQVLAHGAPVAGARVTLHSLLWPRFAVDHAGFAARLDPTVVARETTDTDGRFFVTARADGDFALLAEASGLALGEMALRGFSKASGASDVAIELGPGGALEGRVLVPPGRSPEGTLIALNRGDLRPRTLRVGADGTFRFDALTPGGWTVRRSDFELDPAGGTGISLREGDPEFPADVHVVAGEVTRFDLDLADDRPCLLRGRLVVGGAPAAGWQATLWPDADTAHGTLPTAVLDVEGRFTFDASEPGPRRIRISPPTTATVWPRLAWRVEVARGENEVQRTLGTGRVEGRVSMALGEEPPLLSIDGRCDADVTYSASVAMRADGSFAIDGLPAGDLRLMSRRKAGAPPVELRAFSLAAGGTVTLE
jgi:RNA polymerase sigma factor (sigma-70 family)